MHFSEYLGKGGEAFASGGFGCVFRPALKCKMANEREPNKISKLMTSENALDEYNEIVELKKILNKIPNYTKYFIIDGLTICKPEKLSDSDLQNFKKCTALPKDNITVSNINSSLDKLLLINIPDGGEDLGDIIYKHRNYKQFVEINKSLIQLLLHGIIPMNKLNIYHSDIKDSNILISRKNGVIFAKLIDWGLTVIYNPKKDTEIPRNWKNRPFQYNVPFSNILFSNNFIQKYSFFLFLNNVTRENLVPFIINYINEWNESRGPGHFEYITHLFFIFFKKDHPTENKNIKFFEDTYTMPYITNYIVDILLAFKPEKSNYMFASKYIKEYLDKVFIKNIDIWGLLISYSQVVESIKDIKIFNIIKSLYLNVLCANSDKAINVSKVIKEINKLTKLFNKSNTKTMRKKRNNKSIKSIKSIKHYSY